MNSLGFDKPERDTRVVVAMSGGVDSSTVAALLHEQGYDVVGVTLQLYDYGAALAKKGACCAGQDIYDAKRVAEEKGFPHYVLNYEDKFRQSVVDDFVDSYLQGETPIPCVKCNQTVKFRDLLKVAKDLNADCMATGHYIQRVVNPETHRAELHRALDTGKDQSYFLFATTQKQLEFLRFPLGGWTKDITRQHAERLGLLVCDKPDSQDICFVPNGDYASVVKKIKPEAQRPGDIKHMDGRVLGRHDGVIGYTIGQRKGLGIGGGHNDSNDPFYVVKIDPVQNTVIVGPREALARDVVHLKDCNWLMDMPADTGADDPEKYRTQGIKLSVKLRSVMTPIAATFIPQSGGHAVLYLDAPQFGISPGQAAVCYADNRVLGGGWITRTESTALPIAA
ncbi:MAG: tRNA 2-thiouridine(34) synthase MnmA [Alphaproteobacteria bacterium]|nr:tRNA 2-thiouridine(34) synthase MnmA [Alphaproteobacteria bacterium]